MSVIAGSLLRAAFITLMGSKEAAGEAIYSAVFEAAPSLQVLLPGEGSSSHDKPLHDMLFCAEVQDSKICDRASLCDSAVFAGICRRQAWAAQNPSGNHRLPAPGH